MFLSFKLASFDERNIILSEKTKNNVLQKGDFYRINYSNHLMAINGIYLYFPLRNVKIEPYFNKLKCNFNKAENSSVIEQLKGIEKKILSCLDIGKKAVYRIEEQLSHNFIKIYADSCWDKAQIKDNVEILLKVAGIWDNQFEYGITFRFFFIRPSEMT
jgi:UDP-galactopyranose mutase